MGGREGRVKGISESAFRRNGPSFIATYPNHGREKRKKRGKQGAVRVGQRGERGGDGGKETERGGRRRRGEGGRTFSKD